MTTNEFRKKLLSAVIDMGLTPTNIQINTIHKEFKDKGSVKIYVKEDDKDILFTVRRKLIENYAPIERPYFISVLTDLKDNEPLNQ